MSYLMNKGEHSEMLYSLWLLQEGHIISFGAKTVSYSEPHITIQTPDSEASPTLKLASIVDLISEATAEIKKSRNVFESKTLQPVYDFYDANHIPVKAKSTEKSDVYIMSPGKIGVSVKSFLGSNPSVLNANQHWSGLEYELPASYAKHVGSAISSLPKEVLAEAKFAGYSNEDFAKKVESFPHLPNMVLKWKTEKQANFSQLLPLASGEPDDGRQSFINLMLQGGSDDKPTMFGAVHKDGSFTLTGMPDIWDYLYFDSPSRKRHDYGYVYIDGGSVRMRIVLGIRMKDKTKPKIL